MKKVLFTVALLFTAFTVSAQKAVVKEAKSSKSNPAKAAEIIKPALENAETMNDPETWKLAGDFQKAIYDDENVKMYVPGGGQVNKPVLYASLSNMFDYYIKCTELEAQKVLSGELKKPKMTGKIVKTLTSVRPNLANAGIEAFNEGKHGDALKYFGTYIDVVALPIFAEEESVQQDTLTSLLANYAVLAANTLQNAEAIERYAAVGKSHKEEGYRSLMCLAELYNKNGIAPDSVKWLAAIEEGMLNFPAQEYFTGNMMDYYIQQGRVDEALASIDKIVSNNPTPYFMYVKGVLLYEKKDFDSAISILNDVIAKNENLVAESYSKIGDCFFFPAQEIIEANSELAMDDPKYTEGETKVKVLYEKAAPYYEKAKELAPDNKQLWGQYLMNIYWKLNKSEYEALEKELGY